LGTTVNVRGALLLLPGILCLLLSTPAGAEVQTLSLPQVIELSLQNNGEITSFRSEKGILDAGKTKAGLHFNPILDVEGGTGALTGSSSENYVSLSLSQELFLAGQRQKRLAIADQEIEMYHWQLADRERVLREQVKTAFYDVILSEQRMVLADRSIELNRQLLDVAAARLEAGDIPELELDLIKVALARSEGEKFEAENALHQNQGRLRMLLGLPLGISSALVGDLKAEVSISINLHDLKQFAQGTRPDLKALEYEKSRGDADIVLAEAEAIPNLTAGLAVMRDATAIEVGGIEGKDTAYTIGFKLSMPIPVFDRNQAGVQAATARRSSAESRLSAAVKAVELEVEMAYASFLSADKILSLYRTSIIPQLEENLKLTQEAYRLGEVGILNVIQEQKNFFEVNDGYLLALHGRKISLVKLESAAAIDLTGGVQ